MGHNASGGSDSSGCLMAMFDSKAQCPLSPRMEAYWRCFVMAIHSFRPFAHSSQICSDLEALVC